MTLAHQKYFKELLSQMPDKPGFEKCICGCLWHVDRDLAKLSDKCPQCGWVVKPRTYYKPKQPAQGEDA